MANRTVMHAPDKRACIIGYAYKNKNVTDVILLDYIIQV